MTEVIRYSRIGEEDINFGTGTFEVKLADGRVVTLQQVDVGDLLSDASKSTRTITLDALTVTTLTVSGVPTDTGTLRVPEKDDPGSPISGELWINSSGTTIEYADDAAIPIAHSLVAEDTTQTLTNKTINLLFNTLTGTTAQFNSALSDGNFATLAGSESLSNKTITAPVLSGTVTGTYTLGGTPTVPGTLTAGTPHVMNPYVAGSASSTAHALGQQPTIVHWYLENLSTDAGYAAGDRVFTFSDTAASRGFSPYSDMTVCGVSTDGSLPAVQNKSTGTSTAITASKWKLVIQPYKLV